jgi:hypothetical protein
MGNKALGGSAGPSLNARPAIDLNNLPHAVHYIKDKSTWDYLAATLEESHFAHTSVVKVVVDLQPTKRSGRKRDNDTLRAKLAATSGGGRPTPEQKAQLGLDEYAGSTVGDEFAGSCWFLQSKIWPYHYYWIAEQLCSRTDYSHDHSTFNTREYTTSDRRFVLGAISHYKDSDIYTFELFAGDNVPSSLLVPVYHALRRLTYFGDRLRYRPLSDLHSTIIANVPRVPSKADGKENNNDYLPVVTTDEIFGSMNYQAYTVGTAYGRLNMITDTASLRALEKSGASSGSSSSSSTVTSSSSSSAWADQIVVLVDIPIDLPVVAGLITAQVSLLPCLSHCRVLYLNQCLVRFVSSKPHYVM